MGMSECVQYIRKNFEKKYAENIENGMYDTRDVERLHNDATFIRSYIQNQEKLDDAVDLVHTSLKFRNEVKVNDLSESSFDKELLELGGVYFHSRDNNGHRILWLKVKVHRKDASAERLAAEKQGLVFAIDRAFNESPLHGIVVLLDMTACGLANLDMDFVKYIITIFKLYYPTFLAYMLIYDMPWIFNAAWRVIKAWLNADAVARIKFVTKGDIQMYVKSEDLPPYMGGMDAFEYRHRPGILNEPLYPSDDLNKDKKVHFQEVREYSSNSTSTDSSVDSDTDLIKYDVNANTPADDLRQRIVRNNSNKVHGNINNSAVERKFSVTLGQSQIVSKNSTFVGRLLNVSPGEELTFLMRDSGDSFDVITLTNTLPYPVAFKVKTTSPEKFRVRPSSGLIKSDKTEEVYVYLVPDQVGDVSKDKFLIMAMGAQNENVDPNQLFRDAAKDKIMQHKLKCSIGMQENMQSKNRTMPSVDKSSIDPLISKVLRSPSYTARFQWQDTNTVALVRNPNVTLRMVKNDYSSFTSGDFNDVISHKLQCPDDSNKQVEQLETQNRHMQKQLNVLLIMQVLTILTMLLVMVSYSCFGEDLFSHFLALPFDFCQDTCGRKC